MHESTEKVDHLEARLTLLPTGKGGRKMPIRTGYMPNWWLPRDNDRELASAGIELVEAEELPPGKSGLVRIYPFAAELWSDIQTGAELEMTEGPFKTRGTATVTRVVPTLVPVR